MNVLESSDEQSKLPNFLQKSLWKVLEIVRTFKERIAEIESSHDRHMRLEEANLWFAEHNRKYTEWRELFEWWASWRALEVSINDCESLKYYYDSCCKTDPQRLPPHSMTSLQSLFQVCWSLEDELPAELASFFNWSWSKSRNNKDGDNALTRLLTLLGEHKPLAVEDSLVQIRELYSNDWPETSWPQMVKAIDGYLSSSRSSVQEEALEVAA